MKTEFYSKFNTEMSFETNSLIDKLEKHSVHCSRSEILEEAIDEIKKLSRYIEDLESSVRYLNLQVSKTL